jgi:N,N'-diacetyllegionaminate synthase
MKLVEKHVTITPGENRTDWQAAISIELFNKLTEELNILNIASGNGLLKLNAGEKAYSIFGPNKKAAILTKDVAKGEHLTEDFYTFKRTSQKTDLSQIEIVELHNMIINSDLKSGHCLLKKDLE